MCAKERERNREREKINSEVTFCASSEKDNGRECVCERVRASALECKFETTAKSGVCVCVCVYVCVHTQQCHYGVATVSRIDKILGLFCRILSLLQGSFAKETYNLIDPANQSHPISCRLQ